MDYFVSVFFFIYGRLDHHIIFIIDADLSIAMTLQTGSFVLIFFSLQVHEAGKKDLHYYLEAIPAPVEAIISMQPI